MREEVGIGESTCGLDDGDRRSLHLGEAFEFLEGASGSFGMFLF